MFVTLVFNSIGKCVGENHPSGFLRDLVCCLFLNQRYFETQTVCVCVTGRGGSYLSASFMRFFLPAFLCVASVYLCVWEGVWAFSWHRSDSPLHLPPSLPSSPSPSFLLNLAFHPVQTVCRCCPPLPLHHACRNEIKP